MSEETFCDPFFAYMRKYVPLNDLEKETIAAHCKAVILPKGRQFLQEGSRCDKVHFVVSGKARSFYTDFTGKTITWSFHFNIPESVSKKLFAVDYRSFLNGSPSSVSIETLTELNTILFTREQTTWLIDNLPIFERWMRRLNESAFIHMHDRAFTLLTSTATERYKKLLKDEPYLLQMFSNYYVASYLGIAPQSLSRIRSQK